MHDEKNCTYGKKEELKSWWYRNKKKVLIIGGIVCSVGSGYIIYKNWKFFKCLFFKIKSKFGVLDSPQVTILETELPKELLPVLGECVSKTFNNGEPFNVCQHIRNLPEGQKASAEKINEAVELGILLMENQTVVDSYIKNII